MTLTRAQAEQILRSGAGALQSGRPAEAKRQLDQLVQAGMVNAQVLLLQALACRGAGERESEERALDKLLEMESGNLRGLILKGDCRLAAADDRAASSFYGKAVKLAAQMPSLPADLRAEVARAETALAELSSRYREHFLGQLEKAGLTEDRRPRRFQESLDILLGEKQVYFQQPTAYYFPGLPQIQFYEPEDFAWTAAVEAAAGDVRAELEAVLHEEGLFRPYLQQHENRPSYDFHGLMGNPDWSTLYLWENGGPTPGVAERFPRTMAALEKAPLPHIAARAPSILFSLLKGGARIAPHHGMINARLICHLPLIVPPGCGFRVGNEKREWEPGKLLIFDDTIEHEAWNDSEEDRIVLIFDVWRPELTPDERAAVAVIFEAIDT